MRSACSCINDGYSNKSSKSTNLLIFMHLSYFSVHGRLTLAVREVTMNKEKVVAQNNQISTYEQEIQLLRKHLEGLENEKEKDQKKIAELQEALTRAREVSTIVVC